MFKYFNRNFSFSEQEQLPPSDVKEVFSKFAKGGSAMSADQLRQFLLEHQREPNCTEDDSNRIVQNAMQLRKSDDAGDGISGTREGLTLEEFFHFLFFDEFNGPIKSQVCVFPFLHSLILLFLENAGKRNANFVFLLVLFVLLDHLILSLFYVTLGLVYVRFHL